MNCLNPCNLLEMRLFLSAYRKPASDVVAVSMNFNLPQPTVRRAPGERQGKEPAHALRMKTDASERSYSEQDPSQGNRNNIFLRCRCTSVRITPVGYKAISSSPCDSTGFQVIPHPDKLPNALFGCVVCHQNDGVNVCVIQAVDFRGKEVLVPVARADLFLLVLFIVPVIILVRKRFKHQHKKVLPFVANPILFG